MTFEYGVSQASEVPGNGYNLQHYTFYARKMGFQH
jgi:hypothetical protein